MEDEQLVEIESQELFEMEAGQLFKMAAAHLFEIKAGPVICLLDINDINNNIQSPIRLFADDSIIYRKIKSETDNSILQSDLIQLQTWSNKQQMEFNIP